MYFLFFFFQEEDGIRYLTVTGVQTCALPIYIRHRAEIRAARRAYLGALSYVDDQIGSLLATLRQARLAANTVIMVLADHGDMLGERGLWYKMNFFENACRIPLIVHAPERFLPHRVSESASLLDILPTLVDLASEGEALAYAAPIDGRSLLPALEGGAGPGQVVAEC